MNVNQQQQQEYRVNTFGDDGETVEESVAPVEQPVEQVDESQVEEPLEQAAAPAAPTVSGVGKYRIGNKMFETQEQALEYAQTHVSQMETEQAISDAYQQGIRAGMTQPGYAAPAVTPQSLPQDDINPEELYTDPKAFLDKFAQKIKKETRAEVDQREQERLAADTVWNEFSHRHPMLADFRTEVEDYANKNARDVQAILNTRGRSAAFDYIATKLKTRAAAIAEASKPKRELPNVSTTITPSQKTPSVTPKQDAKKPLSMAEQIRSMKKRR